MLRCTKTPSSASPSPTFTCSPYVADFGFAFRIQEHTRVHAIGLGLTLLNFSGRSGQWNQCYSRSVTPRLAAPQCYSTEASLEMIYALNNYCCTALQVPHVQLLTRRPP